MTRNQPGQEGYGYQQPQYGQGQSSYGYGNDQSYGQQAQGYEQQHGYAENRGQAESYYGTNDQPYQSYGAPPGPPGDHYGQQALHYPPPQAYGEASYSQQSYGSPAPQYSQGQYGGPPPPHQSAPGYGEGYHQQHYMQQPSGEVDAFKSQFDQPHVAPGQYGQYPPQGAEGDRGLMGALAGGAAGAFGGHKMGHGVLGGLGGAVAGSMLEDAYKKHDKKDKKHKSHSRRGSSSSSSSSSSSDSDSGHKKHGMLAGNFHASSRGVRLEPHCLLVAECADMGGHHRSSQIDLNQCLTNTNGELRWAQGGMFGASARNIHLTDGGAVLECELGDGRGGWAYNRIALNERITNNDGRLEFLA